MSDFFTIVAADLIFLAVALSALVADVVATIASLLLFLTISGQMTDAVTFVTFLTCKH